MLVAIKLVGYSNVEYIVETDFVLYTRRIFEASNQ